MNNEKLKNCMKLLQNAGVDKPEKYINIIESMNLTNHLGAVEFIHDADGSLKKMRFGFFSPYYYSSICKKNLYQEK